MKSALGVCTAVVLVLSGLISLTWHGSRATGTDGQQELLAFNKKYEDAHARMDTPAILGFWAEDGVSLLPDIEPIVGKQKIESFVTKALEGVAGYKMLKVDMDFHDIHVNGDWASEWALEHQLLLPPDGKSAFDHYGKFSLILHRQTDGSWKVQQEMWNSNPKWTK